MSQEVLATGTVTRLTGESAVFAVRDLSVIGARLLGPLRLIEGERVTLQIELGAPVAVAAEVVRFDSQRAEAAVRFRELVAPARAAIEAAIAAMLEVPADARVVLVVHPDPETCATMQRDLARIGLAANVCATYDEVVVSLANVAGVIVAGDDTDAILAHLEQHHPDLVRVLLCGDTVGQVGGAAARVHAVLRTPWRIKGLARAFGIKADAVVTTYDQLVALQPDD